MPERIREPVHAALTSLHTDLRELARRRAGTNAVQLSAINPFSKLPLTHYLRTFQLCVPVVNYVRFHQAHSVSRQLIILWSTVQVRVGPPTPKPRIARLFHASHKNS
jgi:hypothetical protein